MGHFLAAYLASVMAGGFLLILYLHAFYGGQAVQRVQRSDWYRTVGVINSIVTIALCAIILGGWA